jgi:hypothetical protein
MHDMFKKKRLVMSQQDCVLLKIFYFVHKKLVRERACKLKPPAKFSYEATRFFIAEKLLSFFFVYGNLSIVDPIKIFSKPKSVINTSSLRITIYV